eukprot:3869516-Rhodomonas_salina.3
MDNWDGLGGPYSKDCIKYSLDWCREASLLLMINILLPCTVLQSTFFCPAPFCTFANAQTPDTRDFFPQVIEPQVKQACSRIRRERNPTSSANLQPTSRSGLTVLITRHGNLLHVITLRAPTDGIQQSRFRTAHMTRAHTYCED